MWSSIIQGLGLVVQGLGYLRDILDTRDKWLDQAELNANLPREILPEHGLQPLYQAGNACTGRVVQAYRIAETYAVRSCPELSGLYNYWGSRSLWGGTGRDGGSHVRDAIKSLIRHGAPPASVWPETLINVHRRPSLAASQQAFKIRGIRGYYRIPSTDVDGIRTALASKCAVIAGWSIDEEFVRTSGPSIIGKPRGKIIGGHAMIIDGYQSSGMFHVQNSWVGWRGNSFGPSRVVISEEFAAAATDVWAVQTERAP